MFRRPNRQQNGDFLAAIGILIMTGVLLLVNERTGIEVGGGEAFMLITAAMLSGIAWTRVSGRR